MKKIILSICLVVLPLSIWATSEHFTGSYIAKINANRYVNLFIAVNGNHVTGYYAYSQTKQNNTYLPKQEWFSGKLNNGHLTLSAYDYPKGINLFAGKVIEANHVLQLQGQWLINPKARAIAISFTSHQLKVNNVSTITQQTINQQSPTDYFYTRISYPQITGDYLTEAEQRFNHFIKNRMQTLNKTYAAEFTKNMREWKQDKSKKLPLPLSTSSNSLVIHNEVTYVSNELISIRFHVYTSYYAAAHPNTSTLSINYDLKTGKPIALNELFNKDSIFLTLIANSAKQQLTKHLITSTTPKEDSDYQQQWIAKGAAATLTNYKNWNILDNGLLVTFDPYQVAAYVYGPQSVVVLFSKLTSVMSKAGPLQTLTNKT